MHQKMSVSDAYYRRKLLNYNITTYDLSTRCVKCFVWNETEGIVVAAKYQLVYMQYDAIFVQNGGAFTSIL